MNRSSTSGWIEETHPPYLTFTPRTGRLYHTPCRWFPCIPLPQLFSGEESPPRLLFTKYLTCHAKIRVGTGRAGPDYSRGMYHGT